MAYFFIPVGFTVEGESMDHAIRQLEPLLPKPHEMSHRPVDSWFVGLEGYVEEYGQQLVLIDNLDSVQQCGVGSGPWRCNRHFGHKGEHRHRAILASWGPIE